MLTLLIIFAVIVLSGLAFWFYNRKQVNSLSEQIDDKNLVITALKNHVEESEIPSVSTKLNEEWRGGDKVNRSNNLTPTVEQAFTKKPNNRNSDSQRKSNNQSSKPNKGTQKKSSETKTQQTSKPKKNKNKNNG